MKQDNGNHAHTPGPWTIVSVNDPARFNLQFAIAQKRSAGLRIAEICRYDDAGLADAALISAAPETAQERDRLKAINAELVKALEAAVRPFDEPARNPSGNPVGEPSWCAQARAALAKTHDSQ